MQVTPAALIHPRAVPFGPVSRSPAYLTLLADLGRSADWLNNEHAQNNTLCSISYWRSVEELEAFARTPIHIRALKFLFKAGMGPGGEELGVIVRAYPPLTFDPCPHLVYSGLIVLLTQFLVSRA